MNAGDAVDCPRCGGKTILKTKNKMDGFSIVGNCLVCALCGAEFGEASTAPETSVERKSADRLAALLGDVAPPEPGADLTPEADYGRFCRNCIHFIEHPFQTRCGRDGKEADPMGECAHFERKSPGRKGKC